MARRMVVRQPTVALLVPLCFLVDGGFSCAFQMHTSAPLRPSSNFIPSPSPSLNPAHPISFGGSVAEETGLLSQKVQRIGKIAKGFPVAAVSMSAVPPPVLPLRDWFAQQDLHIQTFENLGSSGWAHQLRYETKDGQKFFVKTSRKSAAKMFAGEALGLEALGAAQAVRVPRVLQCADDGLGGSYIVMEWLDLTGRPRDLYQFGQAVGKMHKAPPAQEEARGGSFGFGVDNTIGGTPQPNPWTESWADFFREHRIKHQVNLAGKTELALLWTELCAKTNGLETLFEGIQVTPSVLHGDLWSGNMAGCGHEGEGCLFDPATYYGHHEAEWGMSWCASLGEEFWQGYREEIPEDEGFKERKQLYTLYHYLNHYNLFGGGYYGDCIDILDDLIAST